MAYFNRFRNTKGWLYMWERTIRFRHMRKEPEVKRRAKALDLWRDHGIEAAIQAFEVSRPTLYRWRKELRDHDGHLDALDPKSTAPKHVRQRQYPDGLLERIVTLRTEHPGLGKKKLVVLLAPAYAVSESYVGRCLSDLKERNLLPSGKKLSFRAPKGTHTEKPQKRRKKRRRKVKQGMELDTVVRFVDGTKRYILTAIDVDRKFAFARAYTSHSSVAAADFLRKLLIVCPFAIEELQTDNGSEFARYFEQACITLGITHFHTYPRTPKMNATIERFNRTLSEDFVRYHRTVLAHDLYRFNRLLVDWLLWYDLERPHESLGMVSPMRYIVSTLSAEESQRWWTCTAS